MRHSWPSPTGPSQRSEGWTRPDTLAAATGRSLALPRHRRAHRRGGDGTDADSRNCAIIAISCAISIGIQVKE